jgi:MFS family permease
MTFFGAKGEERNIKLYYALTVSTNLWFVASNWLYVWRRFMTFGQLGWVDGIGFGFSLLLDIPTGALADMIGKRRTLIASNLFAGIGIMVMAFSNNLVHIFIGNMITQLGWAMYSGAADAMAYDSLVDLQKANTFSHVLAKANMYMSYAAAFGYFTGGFLYDINWRLPHIIWGLSYVPAVIFSFLIVEPHVDTEKFSVSGYFAKIRRGVQELLLPQLRKYLVLMFVLLGIYFLYTWGFVRPAIATSFGFYTKEQAIILPVLTLACAYLIRYLPAVRRRISGGVGLTILALIMGGAFFMSAFKIGYWGVVPMFLIALAGKFANPWISVVVNEEISSVYRATTLSTISLFSKIPYVFTAILIGDAFEKGKLAEFCMGLGGIIVFAVLISSVLLFAHKKQTDFPSQTSR